MKRSLEPELMDDPDLPDDQLRGALESLDRTHWLFHTYRNLFKRLDDRVTDHSTKTTPYTILDVGAGSGELGRQLSNRYESEVRYLSLDRSQRLLEQFHPKKDGLIQALGQHLPFQDNSIDAVVSSLTLHHLDDQVLVQCLRESKRIARDLVFHLDLLRSRIAVAVTWIGSRLISRNNVFHSDAPHSVMRGRTPAEWETFLRRWDLRGYQLKRTRPFLGQLVHRLDGDTDHSN